MLVLKVWRWRPDGTFVAVCILWIRPDDNEIKDEKEGSRLHFRIVAAHEFGTDRMIEQEKNDFLSGQNNNDEDRSCFVINSISFLLPRTEYKLPQPVFKIDNRVEQISKNSCNCRSL